MEILVLKLESSGIPRYCRAGGEEQKGKRIEPLARKGFVALASRSYLGS